MKPLISVVIVTWNCRDYVLRCLATLSASRIDRFEVIVRDNGSTDGTRAAIRNNHPSVALVGDGRNVGFAAANNEAARIATGHYLMLLNPDTEISATTLEQFIESAGKYKDTALIVPTLLNGDGTVQPSRFSFPTFEGLIRKGRKSLGQLVSRSPVVSDCEVDWAIGACWFMPATIFRAVDGLDANFFMYGEDLDFCWRVRQAGFKIVWTPEIEVVHFGNVSGRQQWGDQRLLRTYRSLVYFWMKHFDPLTVISMIAIRMVYILIGAAVDAVKSLVGRVLAAPPTRRWQERCWQGAAFAQACLDRNAWRLYVSTLRHKN